MPARFRPRGEDGSATIWVLGCAALLAVVTAVAVLRGAAVLARHRAEGAADLAALAAAGHIGLDRAGCAAAAAVAAANGARLQSCVLSQGVDARTGSVVVRVVMPVHVPGAAVGSVSASARAGRGGPPATSALGGRGGPLPAPP
jgi:secretion/DNA translocation related TadE-like protein